MPNCDVTRKLVQEQLHRKRILILKDPSNLTPSQSSIQIYVLYAPGHFEASEKQVMKCRSSQCRLGVRPSMWRSVFCRANMSEDIDVGIDKFAR